MAFGKVARWNNIVAAAYYDCRISESRNSALMRAVTAVIAAAIGGAIAYLLFYYLSTRVGDASPWWYVWRFLMADTLFVAWSNVFCAVFALDAAGGKKMRKLSR
jgi:hypothetical protein